ncbi:MAG TPA: helix-turn-helix transcriptional regulator [Mobilitalea sp.]|nr:helix-turn-helix transcriptional regulator [Mobilitalea sp.]
MAARENCGCTQEEFSVLLDVGVEHYRKLESGIYGLQPEKIQVLYENK